MSLLVNLFGQPGAGKSTGASYVFSHLKLKGVKCELVTEFAKDCVWSEEKQAFRNQFYIFANQLYRIARVYEKMDVIITDSPIMLSTLYPDDSFLYSVHFDKMVYDYHKCFHNLNFLIKRVKPYVTQGRNQTETESDIIGKKIELLFSELGGTVIQGNKEGYEQIIKKVEENL